MEHEELEQIPWSALVAEADAGLDRRWVWLAAVGGLGVAAFLLLRLLVPGGQPVAQQAPTTVGPAVAGCEDDPASCVEPKAKGDRGEIVVSEADLTAHASDDEGSAGDQRMAAVARAEWFVSDWRTTDDSEATVDAIRAAVVDGLDLTAIADRGSGTYVEWARASSVQQTDDGYRVIVLYRQITSEGDSDWVREPVRADSVDVVFVDGIPLAAAEPTSVGEGWQGSG